MSHSSEIDANPLTTIAREHGDFRDPELRDKLIAWLAEELEDGHQTRLERRSGERIPLTSIFMDIGALDYAPGDPLKAEGRGLASEVLQRRPRPLRPALLVRQPEQMRELEEDEGRGLLLIGGPGQGKSTLTQYLAQRHRAALLEVVHEQLSEERQAIRSAWAEHELAGPRELCLPVRVQLPELAAWMSERGVEGAAAVWGHLAECIGKAEDNERAPEPEDLRVLLTRVPGLLIFDGLDEVMEAGEHARATEAINELHRELSEAKAPVIMIATTRPHSYGGQLAGGFASRHLLPLNQARGVKYARVLLEQLHPGARQRQTEGLARLEQAYENRESARLMQTPLQLAIMADLVEELDPLPRRRWQLFSEYEITLIKRERNKPTGFSALMREHRQDVEDILRYLGLLLHVRGEQGAQTRASLTRKQLGAVIRARLAAEGHSANEAEALAEKIEAIALRRLVFLVELSRGRYGFELRSLQEFMAAKALCQGRERDVEDRLEAVGLSAPWRNVVLFAASKFAAERSPLCESLVEICGRYNDPARHPLAAVLREGSSLALAFLRDGSVASPAHEEQLAELAVGVLELPVGEQHVELGQLGGRVDRALEGVLRDGPPGEESFSKWVVLAQLCERSLGWARELFDQHWPRDPSSELSVLWRITYSSRPISWIYEQVAAHVAQQDPRRLRPYRLSSLDDIRAQQVGIRVHGKAAGHQYDYRLKISSLSCERGPEQWRALSEQIQASSIHPGWGPLEPMSSFAIAPSPASLAAALRALSDDFDVDILRWWSAVAPWPLASFLAVVERAEQLSAWASDAEAGAFGVLDDWLKLEATWREDGLELAALLRSWPFLGALHHHYQNVPFVVSFAELAQDVAQRPPPDPAAKEVYQQACDMARWKALVSGQLDEELSATSIAQLYASSRPPSVLESLGALPKILAHRSDAEVRHIVDVVGREVEIHLLGWGGKEALIQRLVRLYCEDPSCVGILHVLALASAFNDVLVPRELIMGELPVAPRFQADLVALRVEHASSADELIELLHSSSGLEHEDTSSLSQTLSRICRRPIFQAPQTLARLYEQISAVVPMMDLNHSQFRERLGALPTGLRADPHWHKFNLPAPAPSVLDQTQRWLSSITIKGLRAFDSLPLEPPEPTHEGGQWLVLLGENGVGKSTLLRAVVLALIEPEDAYGLVDRAKAPYRRNGASEASCALTFDGADFRVQIANGKGRERVVPPPRSPHERPFVLAYGCARGTAASGDRTEYAQVDRVATLFDDSAHLIPASTWMLKLHADAYPGEAEPEPGARELYETVCETLKALLPGVEKVEVRGAGPLFTGPKIGARVPLASLSDGYITTAGWIIDLLARWVQRASERDEALAPNFNREMRGLVVIDELDLHLHPKWQREVIAKVRECFPQLSFIVTTHNPLTLLSARKGEVFVLERALVDEEETLRAVQLDLPPGIRADQVLTGEWFGLASTRDAETLELLHEHYRQLREGLASDDPEYVRVHDQLRERLDGFPGTTFEQLVRHVGAELHDTYYPDPTPARREQMRRVLKQRAQAKLAQEGE